MLGSEYSIVCTANGSITPIIQWYNENDELLNTSTVSVTTIAPALISVVSVLTFNPLRLSNGGHYQCSAVLANGNSTLVENDTVMILIQCEFKIHNNNDHHLVFYFSTIIASPLIS